MKRHEPKSHASKPQTHIPDAKFNAPQERSQYHGDLEEVPIVAEEANTDMQKSEVETSKRKNTETEIETSKNI